MSVTLGNDAVEQMVVLLNNSKLHDFNGRAYYYDKIDKEKGEYIVVNHLPFLHRGAVEEGTVNVNIHVPKLGSYEPASKRLKALAKDVVALFPSCGRYLGSMWFEFLADSRPALDEDGTYYVNLQFKVIFNDLNY